MSDNLALDLLRAMAVPDSPVIPFRFERPSGGRRGLGDRLILTFRHPLTGEEAIVQLGRDSTTGGWQCHDAQTGVSDAVLERAFALFLRW